MFGLAVTDEIAPNGLMLTEREVYLLDGWDWSAFLPFGKFVVAEGMMVLIHYCQKGDYG